MLSAWRHSAGCLALALACSVGCLAANFESTAPAQAKVAATDGAQAAGSPIANAKAAKPATKHDWPSFRNGNQLHGVATSTLPAQLELLWKYPTGEMVASTAAIVDGHVYAASLGGNVVCLDLRDGKLIWSYRSIEDPDPKVFAPGFKSSPTVTADAVYLGDEDGIFHAIERGTGKKRWTFKTGAEVVSSASVSGDQVIFGSHDNSLYSVKQSTGEKAWQFVTQGPVNCSPAISGDHTFVTGCDEHLRVIDIRDSQEKADIPLGTYLIASPAVVDNILYVGTYASEVVAVDWKTRTKIWTYKDPQREFPYHASAAVTDKYVLVGSRDKRMHCIDRQTGKGVWMFTTRAKVDSSAVVVGERVFFGSSDGNLYCANLNDGRELWKFTDLRGKGFTASPAVGEQRLVIGSEAPEGYIYCFGAPAAGKNEPTKKSESAK